MSRKSCKVVAETRVGRSAQAAISMVAAISKLAGEL